MKELSTYMGIGILIAWGIAFIIASVPRIETEPFAALGVFAGGLFIGIGLTPFKIRDNAKEGKK